MSIVAVTASLALLMPLTVARVTGAADVAVPPLVSTWKAPTWLIRYVLSEPLALLVVKLSLNGLLAVCSVAGAATKLLRTSPLDAHVPALPAVAARTVSVAVPMILPLRDRIKDGPMISRREFLQATAAASALMLGSGLGPLGRLAAQQRLTQADITRFDPLGTVTLLYVADTHAQLVPLYFREPSVNLGVGEARGLPPHLTDAEFRKAFNIAAGSADAYALTADAGGSRFDVYSDTR